MITNSALLGAPFAVGGSNVIRGNAAVRANRELASNAVLAGELALSGASKEIHLMLLIMKHDSIMLKCANVQTEYMVRHELEEPLEQLQQLYLQWLHLLQ